MAFVKQCDKCGKRDVAKKIFTVNMTITTSCNKGEETCFGKTDLCDSCLIRLQSDYQFEVEEEAICYG